MIMLTERILSAARYDIGKSLKKCLGMLFTNPWYVSVNHVSDIYYSSNLIYISVMSWAFF
jgi:hypothetical protein